MAVPMAFPPGKGARITVIGSEKVVSTLYKIDVQGRFVFKQTTEEFATRILNASQAFVPVDTGSLKATGRVIPNEHPGSGITEWAVAYGDGEDMTEKIINPKTGKPVDYATYVHETLEMEHAPPTMAKFLEVPARILIDKWQTELAPPIAGRFKTIWR